jgi:hypothetical protein
VFDPLNVEIERHRLRARVVAGRFLMRALVAARRQTPSLTMQLLPRNRQDGTRQPQGAGNSAKALAVFTTLFSACSFGPHRPLLSSHRGCYEFTIGNRRGARLGWRGIPSSCQLDAHTHRHAPSRVLSQSANPNAPPVGLLRERALAARARPDQARMASRRNQAIAIRLITGQGGPWRPKAALRSPNYDNLAQG